MRSLLSFLAQVAYNLAFLLFFTLTGWYFLLRLWRRGRLLPRFEQRFGMYSSGTRKALLPGTDIWFHAVSVGEVKLVMVVHRRLRALKPDLRSVITTTTPTGFNLAASRLQDSQTHVLYNPIDFVWAVGRAFDLVKPKRLVLVESEIWPNYLWCAKRRNVPIYLMNARLSERTERRYRIISAVIRPLLDKLSLVFAQDKTEVERLARAGFPAERIFDVDSLKYEVATLNDYERVNLSWWEHLNWPADALVLMGGSTHDGEEEVLVRIFQKLHVEFPKLRLVIVPRHMERGNKVRDMCRENGASVVMRSELGRSALSGERQAAKATVLVVDSTGEMLALYSRAAIVFVGKSLCGKGGQNFVEAAPTGAAIVAGPQMQNFMVQLREFKAAHAIVQVGPGDLSTVILQLEEQIRDLIADPNMRHELGQRAKRLFETKRGSARRTAEMIYESFCSENRVKEPDVELSTAGASTPPKEQRVGVN